MQSRLQQVALAICYEDAPDASDALESFVFVLTHMLPPTSLRDRDFVIRGNLSRAAAEVTARQFLLQILTSESRLLPMGRRPRTFRILIEAKEGCAPTGGVDEPTFGKWMPASGIPFRANAASNETATLSTHMSKHDSGPKTLHPLEVLESGILHIALHVEEARAQKHAMPAYVPHPSASQAPSASMPTDLDDPDSDAAPPVRKRKLYAQVHGGAGPMSDESSVSSSGDSDTSD